MKPESRGEEVLLEGLPDEPQFGLWRATTDPRRLKHARFSWAHGDPQVLDPTPPQTQLEALLYGLRIASSHLDYASVRRSMASAPGEGNAVYFFRRELTYLEQQLTRGMTDHLLAEYVPDAHVAQVLTDSHLAKARDLWLYHIEPMGKGRHLVHARDPEPWIFDATPSEAVRDAARSGFGDMLLTEEFLRAHPPHMSARSSASASADSGMCGPGLRVLRHQSTTPTASNR